MKLTIFQKMLFAPAVAMVVYGAYLYVMHSEYQRATSTIEEIRDESLPVIQLAEDNVRLFDGLVTQMKDAVMAGEKDWLVNTRTNRVSIEKNLLLMEKYNVVPAEKLGDLRSVFSRYYRNAYALSEAMLGRGMTAEYRNELIENVEHDHSEVMAGLVGVRTKVSEHVDHAVARTTQTLDNILIMGVSIGAVLIVLVTALTFGLSLTTRRSLTELVGGMRDLAEGHPDFSKRLAHHGKDELGDLIKWFNLLSDKLEKDYKEIERISITDKLTKLYNRMKIEQLLENELHRSERENGLFSVLLLDLDHFKSVNDNYGHLVGDKVLQEVASVLRGGIRCTDHVGRWGGEEFIIIAPGADAESAVLLAENLRRNIEKNVFSDVGHKTSSIGVTSYRHGDTKESMTLRADEYLYKAKMKGRNQVVGDQ